MRVLLGVSGSVAAIKVPELAQQLLDARHEVSVVATSVALHFFEGGQLPSHVKLYRRWPHCHSRALCLGRLRLITQRC